MKQASSIAILAHTLKDLEKDVNALQVTLGFDAFVDTIVDVVDDRATPESWSKMETIGELGVWAHQCEGKSGLREMVSQGKFAGGCSVNMGDGLGTLGLQLNSFSAIEGYADTVFRDLVSVCASQQTLGQAPGEVFAMEFNDGKLMLCENNHFSKFSPEYLRAEGRGKSLKESVQASSGVGFTSWSLYSRMNEVWDYFCDELFSELNHRPFFFFDLADPASRSAEDIIEMSRGLARFQKIGPTSLSLNGNEADQLAKVFGLQVESPVNLATQLREKIGIEEVGIHLRDRAILASVQHETAQVLGPYCEKPVKSVGAGDRFNAGYFTASLLGLEPEMRLLMGTACSGYFVRKGRSATWLELVEFVEQWAAEATSGESLADSNLARFTA